MPKIKVRVNDRIARYGGEFVDYIQGKSIGAEPVEVELTPLVMRWISRGEVVEVHDEEPGSWPDSMPSDLIDLLEDAGVSPNDVERMTDEELLAIKGIGVSRLKAIRAAFHNQE